MPIDEAVTPGDIDAERELVDRARAGDARAFTALISAHDQRLRGLAYRLLGDRDLMDDVLQDAYLRAFQRLDAFRGDARFSTWLYRIVFNACMDALRRRRPHDELDEAHTAAADERADHAERTVTAMALADALDALSPQDRASVLLVDRDGFSYEEAASALGLSRAALASRLMRARQALRLVLTAQPEEA